MSGGISTPTRRAVVAGGFAFMAAPLCSCGQGASSASRTLSEIRVGRKEVALIAQEHNIPLGASKGPSPTWLYGETPFPVLRLAKGETLNLTLENRLKEHTSIHWHGVRVPNAMDGVPYVTQLPVQPGEKFTYKFMPPDPGTYFFHPHCNTSEQLGRGLAGVLIVEDGAPFDGDIVCVLKDWRLKEDGSFLPFITNEGAGRSGTFGGLRTVNGAASPTIAVPAGANIRLRLVNVDSSRVGEIGIEGAEAQIAAIDGNAVEPFALEGWRLGPAMRLDVVLRTPSSGKFALLDYFASEPVTLASFQSEGMPKRNDAFVPPAIPLAALPEPDLANAEFHQLKLSESAKASDYPDLAPLALPDGTKIDLLDSLCSTSRTFWAIDGKTWPERDHRNLPPPLFSVARGKTVIAEFLNTTPHVHPMHLHGHTFKVLETSKLKRPVHWADTVLAMPDERVRIAFVADNPGNWMLHCHIVEHQDTGMMAWFHVE